ncbi:MAG TPA: hypothetical protein PLO19_04430 [Candidatus Cryosericum sp.]|nr:hypothetical protein [Candidatus Cryosericum sp.]HPS69976.1 hypothetical protein [Candidatus Cryosericum sp.]
MNDLHPLQPAPMPPQPTENRLHSTPAHQGRPSMFDPAQIAGGAVYAILLYLGLFYALGLIPATSRMALQTRGTVALVAGLVLAGIPFGIIAWMRDRLAHQVVAATPEQILRLDDAVRWLVPEDVLQAYAGPMTTLRLNLLDLLTEAEEAHQHVPDSAWSQWPSPLDRLASAVFAAYYGGASGAAVFDADDVQELRAFLAEHHGGEQGG